MGPSWGGCAGWTEDSDGLDPVDESPAEPKEWTPGEPALTPWDLPKDRASIACNLPPEPRPLHPLAYLEDLPVAIMWTIYQQMMVEMERCCNAFFVKHQKRCRISEEFLKPGSAGLWELVMAIQNQIEQLYITHDMVDSDRGDMAWEKDQMDKVSGFRHTIVHRGQKDKKMLPEYVEYVIYFARLLKDEELHRRFQNVMDTLRNMDPNDPQGIWSNPVIASFLAPPNSFPTALSLVRALQRCLEESCFKLQARHNPESGELGSFEAKDLQSWIDEWHEKSTCCEIDPGNQIRPNPDGRLFSESMWNQKELRNQAAHGCPSYRDEAGQVDWCGCAKLFHSAIEMALLLDDAPQALEMELLVQQWAQQISRDQALALFRADLLGRRCWDDVPIAELPKRWKTVPALLNDFCECRYDSFDSGLTQDELRSRWIFLDVLLTGRELFWMPPPPPSEPEPSISRKPYCAGQYRRWRSEIRFHVRRVWRQGVRSNWDRLRSLVEDLRHSDPCQIDNAPDENGW